MSQLSSYIFKTVFGAIVLVLLLVVGLDVVSAIVDQLEDVRGDYTFLQAVYYVMLTIPGRISEYVPLACLIGCLIGMGSLASSSELVVMRANGMSLFSLAGLALRPVIIFIVLSGLIVEFVAPHTENWAKTHKDLLRLGSERSLVSNSGLWHLEGNTFMHFNVVQPGGVLYGALFFHFDDNELLKKRISARRASFVQGKWLLEDVHVISFEQSEITSQEIRQRYWETELTPERLVYLINEPSQLAPSQLFRYAEYLEGQQIDASSFRLAFWQKSLQPFAVISLMLIALSFIFGPLRSATMGYRVFVGVIVGIAFQFAQNLLGPSSLVYGFNPLIAVAVPIAICFIVGSFLLVRAR